MVYFFDYVIPAIFFFSGLFVFDYSFREMRKRALPRCFNCRYSLRGVEGLACPECGYRHADEREKLHGKLHRKLAAIGAAAMVLGLTPAVIWGAQTVNCRITKQAMDATDKEVGSVFNASGKEDVLPDYSSGTRWVARQMGLADDTDSLDSVSIRCRNTGNLIPNGDTVMYAAMWLMSPGRHYGWSSRVMVACEYSMNGGQSQTPIAGLEAALAKVSLRERVVKKFSFSGQAALDDACMKYVSRQPSLTSLSAWKADLSETALAPVAKFQNLRNVEMRFIRPVTDAHVGPLLKSPKLEILSLQGPEGSVITPAGTALLNAPGLKVAEIMMPYRVGDDPAPLDCFLRVNYLKLVLPDIDEARLKALGKSSVMQGLVLDLRDNPKLERGALDWMDSLATSPHSVTIRGNGRMDVGAVTRLMGRFTGAPQSGTANSRQTWHQVDLEGFKLDRAFFDMVRTSNVTSLKVRRCTFGPQELEGLKGATALRDVLIQGSGFGPGELNVIAGLGALELVKLLDVPVTEGDLKVIGKIPRLNWLSLTEVDDAMIRALGQGRGVMLFCLKDQTTVMGRRMAPRVDVNVEKKESLEW